jgi:hypothetical protein
MVEGAVRTSSAATSGAAAVSAAAVFSSSLLSGLATLWVFKLDGALSGVFKKRFISGNNCVA